MPSTLHGRMDGDFPPLVDAAIQNDRHPIALDDEILQVL
jgi:hypothetical protein